MPSTSTLGVLLLLTGSSSVQGFHHPCAHRTITQQRRRIVLPTRQRPDLGQQSWPSRYPFNNPSSSLHSLIQAQDAWGNYAALTGAAAAGQVIGKKTKIGKLLGPPVTAMALTFFLATIGVLHPGGSQAAKSLQMLSLQLATPLILLGADLRDAASRCGPLLLSFITASLATIVACLLGWMCTGSSLTAALGARDGLAIAAGLMAKNIGGGINYIAVCSSLNASPVAVAAGLCVDNIFALVYFPATSALAAGLPDLVDVDTTKQEDHTTTDDQGMTVFSMTTVLWLSAVLLWLGELIGGKMGALPLCTILTVLFASIAPSKWMAPLRSTAETFGTVCLYVFFSTAGAPGLAVADSVRASLLPLGLFLTILYSVHGLILALCHKLFKGNKAFVPQRLLVASSAAIGGPATSVALAQASEWESLVVPSLLVGNIGYAIATFCGLAYYAFFSS
jgi:uncharacterized membrane protein